HSRLGQPAGCVGPCPCVAEPEVAKKASADQALEHGAELVVGPNRPRRRIFVVSPASGIVEAQRRHAKAREPLGEVWIYQRPTNDRHRCCSAATSTPSLAACFATWRSFRPRKPGCSATSGQQRPSCPSKNHSRPCSLPMRRHGTSQELDR